MSRVIKREEFGTAKGILQFAEPYVGMARTFYQNDPCVVTRDDKKIIPAGTIYPSNDANAIGVIYWDVDVTDGDADGSVLVEAHINTAKLPAIPTSAAKGALKGVFFYPLQALTVTGSATPLAIDAGEDADTEHDVVYSVPGLHFRPEAATLSNWTIAGESTTKVAVESITVSDDGTYVTIHTKNSAAAVAGSVTVVPKAACTSTGDVPASATTIATVA